MDAIFKIYAKFLVVANALRPAMMLIVRLWISRVFFASGMVSVSDWGNTIYLFTSEFHVPILSPQLAAIISTAFELLCPALLTVGCAARLATLPLLAITGVIYFTYDQNVEHVYWAMLLGMILCFGAGAWSLDGLIEKKCRKAHA